MTSKVCIQTDNAPKAIGPYSQAIASNGFLYVSGQLPLDPASGELEKEDIAEATRIVFSNMKAIVEEAGASMSNVVKVNVYLMDMGQFQTINGIYAEFFPEPFPARAVVQVAGLPLGAPLEAEAVVSLNN